MRAGAFGLKAAIAFAALIGFGSVGTQPAHAVPVDCSTIDTFGEWETASNAAQDPGCLDDDKLYILEETDIPDATEISFQNIGDVVHIVVQTFGDDPPTEMSLVYTIEVTDPDKDIVAVQIDSTVAIGDQQQFDETVVTKVIEDIDGNEIDTIVSINGEPDDTADVGLFSEDFLRIHETIEIGDGHVLASVSNAFLQRTTTIPEPVTLATLGFGLVGLGVMRRRRLG